MPTAIIFWVLDLDGRISNMEWQLAWLAARRVVARRHQAIRAMGWAAWGEMTWLPRSGG